MTRATNQFADFAKSSVIAKAPEYVPILSPECKGVFFARVMFKFFEDSKKDEIQQTVLTYDARASCIYIYSFLTFQDGLVSLEKYHPLVTESYDCRGIRSPEQGASFVSRWLNRFIDDSCQDDEFKPFRNEAVSPKSAVFEQLPHWLQVYIQGTILDGFKQVMPAPPQPLTVPVSPRLSKEDWLRTHYPDLQELPKWRFPRA
jgi:hypothetical protein